MVLQSGIDTPTDGKNTVIDGSVTAILEDTRLVALESSGTGGDTNGDWSD